MCYLKVSIASLFVTIVLGTLLFFSVKRKLSADEDETVIAPNAAGRVEINWDKEKAELDLEAFEVNKINELMDRPQKSLRCPIYTFVKNVTDSNRDSIGFWIRSWHRQGFSPYVLSEKDALTRPEYGSIISKVASAEFYAGYMKWLALASVQGGLYVDVNIIPMSGGDSPFQTYKETCKPPDALVIYDGYGFKVLQTDAKAVHLLLKNLAKEPQLKGSGESWLTANKVKYEISRIDSHLAIVDVYDPLYFKKHRRFSQQSFSPEYLKLYLARVNFMNNNRVVIVKLGQGNASPIEDSLLRSLVCPLPIPIEFDRLKIMPKPFECDLRVVSDFPDLNRQDEPAWKTLAIVLVEDPRTVKDRNCTTVKALPVDQLKSLLRSENIIFVPLGESYTDTKTFLEFRLGFPLDIIPEFGRERQAGPEDTVQDEGMKSEVDAYEMILQHYKYALSGFLEFM